MLIVHFGPPAHFHLLHCIKGRQEYIVHPSPMASSLGRAMDIAVPVGWWAGWAIQRFLQPPRISSQGALEGLWLGGQGLFCTQFPQQVGDRPWGYTFIQVWKQTCWRSIPSMHSRLQHWNDGTWDKETMVRKRDRPPPKKLSSHHEESISFPLSKALERLSEWRRRKIAWKMASTSAGLGRKCPQTATVSLRMRWTF